MLASFFKIKKNRDQICHNSGQDQRYNWQLGPSCSYKLWLLCLQKISAIKPCLKTANNPHRPSTSHWSKLYACGNWKTTYQWFFFVVGQLWCSALLNNYFTVEKKKEGGKRKWKRKEKKTTMDRKASKGRQVSRSLPFHCSFVRTMIMLRWFKL